MSAEYGITKKFMHKTATSTSSSPLLTHSVAASYIACLLDTAEQQGADRDQLLRECGLTAAQLDPGSVRLPVGILLKLFVQAERLTGDSMIGIHMAENVRPGTFNALGYAAMSCSTLGDALCMIPRYEALVYDGGTTQVVCDQGRVCVSWTSGLPEQHDLRAFNEVIVGGWLSFGRWIAGKHSDDGLVISFRHPPPPQRDEYTRFFDCPVRFSAPANSLSGPLHALQMPLIQRDEEMRALMENQARLALGRIREGHDVTAQVVSHIQRLLPVRAPALSAVAAELHVSERTLRRRLQQEGAQFSDLVIQVRRQLSQHYLERTTLSILEVALLLGYSEQSSFTAAFRKWFDQSPRDYRKQHRP